MSLAQGNNTPTRPRIEPGSPDPESDALTTRPVHPQNIDRGYTLEPPHKKVLTSTHDLCFGGKIRKMYTPVNPSFTILNDTSNITDRVFAIFSKTMEDI